MNKPTASQAQQAISGWVFNIQRFSIHDGPGIRTTVFMKGCPLRCQWCHNPEGLVAARQIRVAMALCTRCGRCMAACEHGGHVVTPDSHALHTENCVQCGQCVEACPAGAAELVGTRMTVDEVMGVVRRDVPFYETSGGGMTLSGGEPLAQPEFAVALLEAARAEGIATAVETSACAPAERLRQVASLCDAVMIDLKHTDDARHRALTGASNKAVLANIRMACEADWRVLLRVPWVPGYNADDGFLEGLVGFLGSLSQPPPVELMLYHRLGASKWESLGGTSPIPADIPSATAEQAEPWVSRLKAEGFDVRAG